MKKNILFLGAGYKGWKGGLYYVKNMIFSLLQYEKTADSFQIYILVNEQDYTVFEEYEKKYDNVILIINKQSFAVNFRKKVKKTYYNLAGISFEWELLTGIVEKYHIEIIFPLSKIDDKYIDKEVSWIPDFQPYHYPEFFSEQELEKRKGINLEIAQKHSKLILSSYDAYEDYKKLYPAYTHNVYVVPFVSAIDKALVSSEKWKTIRNKFLLPPKYFFVANQFWPHKNHITVFKALNILKSKYNVSVSLVCTGSLCKDRTPEYLDGLMNYISENDLEQEIKILGLIDREEQLLIMESCLAVVQPSLFEGWGTVVEDAKTLNVSVVMSDINVHYEQKTENCIIFQRENAEQLAEILLKKWEAGIQQQKDCYDFVQCAKEYGKMFYEALQG